MKKVFLKSFMIEFLKLPVKNEICLDDHKILDSKKFKMVLNEIRVDKNKVVYGGTHLI